MGNVERGLRRSPDDLPERNALWSGSLSGCSEEGRQPRERTLPENVRFRQAVVCSLVLLATAAVVSPRSGAQVPVRLQASASGEYSAALSELPESLKKEWMQQKRLLLEDFEQQALDNASENRVSLRELKEDAAEARYHAQQEYREEGRELHEDHTREVQRLAADLPADRYQRSLERLQEDYRDDVEDLRIEHGRRIGEINEDLQEELDDLAAELEQSLFDLRTEERSALEQLEAETIEALLAHYQRQLEIEALRTLISSRGAGPLGDEAVSKVLDYLWDQVSIETARTDLGHSRTRITVTMRAAPAAIDSAMELLNQ